LETANVVINRLILNILLAKRFSIKFKTRVLVELGEFLMRLPVYVDDMKNDCLLGNDFFSAMNFEEVFTLFFGIPSQEK